MQAPRVWGGWGRRHGTQAAGQQPLPAAAAGGEASCRRHHSRPLQAAHPCCPPQATACQMPQATTAGNRHQANRRALQLVGCGHQAVALQHLAQALRLVLLALLGVAEGQVEVLVRLAAGQGGGGAAVQVNAGMWVLYPACDPANKHTCAAAQAAVLLAPAAIPDLLQLAAAASFVAFAAQSATAGVRGCTPRPPAPAAVQRSLAIVLTWGWQRGRLYGANEGKRGSSMFSWRPTETAAPTLCATNAQYATAAAAVQALRPAAASGRAGTTGACTHPLARPTFVGPDGHLLALLVFAILCLNRAAQQRQAQGQRQQRLAGHCAPRCCLQSCSQAAKERGAPAAALKCG